MQSLLFHSFLIILLNLSLLLLCHHSYCSHHIHLLFITALLQSLQHSLASPLLLLQLLHPFVVLYCSFLAVIAFLYPSFIPPLLPSGFCNLHGIVHSIMLFDSPATVRRHLVICDSSSKNVNPWTTIMKITPWMIHPSTITHSTTNDDTPVTWQY